MTANLAISDGWNWNTPLMPSQRVASVGGDGQRVVGDDDQYQQEQRPAPPAAVPAPRQR